MGPTSGRSLSLADVPAQALYGCMYAGVVPVPVNCPEGLAERSHPDVVSSGFVLSACGASLALTDDASLKLLTDPTSSKGEIVRLKGWPSMSWTSMEHLPSKSSKTLQLPVATPPRCTAYIATSRHRESNRGLGWI